MNTTVYNPWLLACAVFLAVILINGSLILMVKRKRAGIILWVISVLAIIIFLVADGKSTAAIIISFALIFHIFKDTIFANFLKKYGSIDIFTCFKRKKS